MSTSKPKLLVRPRCPLVLREPAPRWPRSKGCAVARQHATRSSIALRHGRSRPPDITVSRTRFLPHELDDAGHDRHHDDADDEHRQGFPADRDVAEIVAAEHEEP